MLSPFQQHPCNSFQNLSRGREKADGTIRLRKKNKFFFGFGDNDYNDSLPNLWKVGYDETGTHKIGVLKHCFSMIF